MSTKKSPTTRSRKSKAARPTKKKALGARTKRAAPKVKVAKPTTPAEAEKLRRVAAINRGLCGTCKNDSDPARIPRMHPNGKRRLHNCDVCMAMSNARRDRRKAGVVYERRSWAGFTIAEKAAIRAQEARERNHCIVCFTRKARPKKATCAKHGGARATTDSPDEPTSSGGSKRQPPAAAHVKHNARTTA